MSRDMVIGLTEATKVLAKLMPVMKRGFFKEENIGPEVERVKLLIEIDLAHIFRNFGHDIFSHGAHDEHSKKREVVVVGDEVFIFEVGVWVVLDKDVVDVAVVVEVEDSHVRGLEVDFLIGVVIVHLRGD